MKNRVQQFRNERGLNQDEFARAMCVSRQTISSIETGKYNASLQLAHKIARFFGVKIEDVFIFEEEQRWNIARN